MIQLKIHGGIRMSLMNYLNGIFQVSWPPLSPHGNTLYLEDLLDLLKKEEIELYVKLSMILFI